MSLPLLTKGGKEAMSPLLLALAWPVIQGSAELSFTVRSVEVFDDGKANVHVALVNRSARRLRVYPPFDNRTVAESWTLPKSIRRAPNSLVSCPSFAYYEERDIEPDEIVLEVCEIKAPETEPPLTSYRATIAIDYSSASPRFYHVDLQWPGTPPAFAELKGGEIWVDVENGRIVRAGVVRAASRPRR
jgi:hypothetical protein